MSRIIIALLAALAIAAGMVSAAAARPDVSAVELGKVVVPNVVGLRMDRATRTLKQRGLRVNEECSGLFGCVVKANWWVCSQDPRPGTRLRKYSVVVIYAERRGEC